MPIEMPHARETGLGLLTLLSFSASVFAAVLAIDMYSLLRTGRMGRTWRILIIASVMLVLHQALRMGLAAGWFQELAEVEQIAELGFVLMLTYAFYLQRRIFTRTAALRGIEDTRTPSALLARYAPAKVEKEAPSGPIAASYESYEDDEIEWADKQLTT